MTKVVECGVKTTNGGLAAAATIGRDYEEGLTPKKLKGNEKKKHMSSTFKIFVLQFFSYLI